MTVTFHRMSDAAERDDLSDAVISNLKNRMTYRNEYDVFLCDIKRTICVACVRTIRSTQKCGQRLAQIGIHCDTFMVYVNMRTYQCYAQYVARLRQHRAMKKTSICGT